MSLTITALLFFIAAFIVARIFPLFYLDLIIGIPAVIICFCIDMGWI